MSREHTLKSYTDFFQPMVDGSKPFDVRYNDRGFQKGDVIVYREWDPNLLHGLDVGGNALRGAFTGKTCRKVVTYVMTYGLSPNYVALGLADEGFDFDSSKRDELRDKIMRRTAHLAQGHDLWPGWPGTWSFAEAALQTIEEELR